MFNYFAGEKKTNQNPNKQQTPPKNKSRRHFGVQHRMVLYHKFPAQHQKCRLCTLNEYLTPEMETPNFDQGAHLGTNCHCALNCCS